MKTIACPKCSHKFALDQALNREIELQMREELGKEFKTREAEIRKQLTREATEKAAHNSAELQEQAEKAQLEAERRLADERDKIRQSAQDQMLEEHRLKDAEKNKQLEDSPATRSSR